MQGVRFINAEDGTTLAWQRSGQGPPLVKAAAWLTHLDYDRESPIWSHQTAFLEEHFDYLRYDERGCGLSDRETGALGLDTWVNDLHRVVEASGIARPFTLMAQSQAAATAVAYAALYPDDVSLLLICGGYTRGVDHRGDPKAAALYHAMVEVFQHGFDDDNSAFREVFTSRFFGDDSPEKKRWFADLCRKSTTPETGARLLRARADVDASHHLGDVRAKTVIIHADNDRVVPISEGRFIASRINDAEMISVASGNHIFQPDEPAWSVFAEQILERTGRSPETAVSLTAREEMVLAGLKQAKSNKEIARDLDMSEKTVRNHLTHIFAKLGVKSRAEALLKVKP